MINRASRWRRILRRLAGFVANAEQHDAFGAALQAVMGSTRGADPR
jgi:hypothetical protein